MEEGIHPNGTAQERWQEVSGVRRTVGRLWRRWKDCTAPTEWNTLHQVEFYKTETLGKLADRLNTTWEIKKKE